MYTYILGDLWFIPGFECKLWTKSDQVSGDSFLHLFAEMDFSEECRKWDMEADLCDVLRYVRGSRKLSIPQEWRNVIPTSLPF